MKKFLVALALLSLTTFAFAACIGGEVVEEDSTTTGEEAVVPEVTVEEPAVEGTTVEEDVTVEEGTTEDATTTEDEGV